LQGKNIIYAACINSDPPYALERTKRVYELGGNAIHLNFWSGFGTYKAIRELDLPLFIHFQKSGDKILTNRSHNFHIEWIVICKLAGLLGVDFIHAGMWGGYMDNGDDLQGIFDTLRSHNVLPSLSCGMNASLVKPITERFGIDYMATVGGAIHSHPKGTKAGAEEMRYAVENWK